MPQDKSVSNTNSGRFRGYTSPNYTMVPDQLFDEQLADLSGAELKALLYVIRRTFGFKKDSDNISLNQLLNGITTKTGERLDHGTGLSRSTLVAALKSLVNKNLLIAEQQTSAERGNEPTNYRLNILYTPYTPSSKIELGGSENRTRLVRKSNPQDTVLQETELQDLSILRNGSNSDENVDNSEDQSSSETIDASTSRPIPTRVREKGNGEFTAISDVVAEKIFRPTKGVSEARQVILEYIADFALEMGDEAKLRASVTRAVNLYRRSGRDLGEFTGVLYEARSRTKEYTANVKKRKASPDGQYAGKNKMPYFFSVLEELLGLKEADSEDRATSPLKSGHSGIGAQRPKKPRAGYETSLT